MNIKEGKIPFKGFETYYRIVNPDGKKTPLIVLHGGPGSTHNYFEVIDYMAEEDDRPIVMYDQIGCGKSFIEGHPEMFTADVWMDELEEIRKEVKKVLDFDNAHILGQSWGGMLAIWYAITRKPEGVKSYILSSTLPSAKLWEIEQHRQITYMPEDMQKAIKKAVESEDYSTKEYLEALDEFMLRHCAGAVTEESPECLRRAKKSGSEAYIVGWGHNEFTPTGTLSSYDFTDRLHEIETPCLVTNGQRDLCTPYIAKTMYDRIPNAEWELFQYSRHMPYVEENEKYVARLKKWLNQND